MARSIVWFLLTLSAGITYGAIVPAVEMSTSAPRADFDANSNEMEDEEPASGSSTLKLVHVVFRHGPRTPVVTYPKDPYANETYEPFGWGQLTNNGKVELFKIGKQLRRRYKQFLGPYYKPDILHAQATESSRTLMSLQMVLAGMYPPQNTPMEWNLMLDWQPIPVFADPDATDLRLRQNVPCPRYKEAVFEVMNLPEVKELHATNAALLQDLAGLTGMNMSYSHDVTNLLISFKAQEAYGLKLPEWSKDYYPDKMLPIAKQSYIYDAYTPEMKRLKGGFFLKHMFEQMHAKISKKLKPSGRRMFLYCAHDWSVTNILSALNVWEPQIPRFSALIAIELHRSNETGRHFVKIYFQNDPHKEPILLHVPGCGKHCPIEKLVKLSEEVLPNAPYDDLCQAKSKMEYETISYH